MEKSLNELAGLFNEVRARDFAGFLAHLHQQMAVMVEQQDTVIDAVEATAVDVESNTRAA